MNNTAMGNRMCTNKHAKLVFSCWRHKTRRKKHIFPRGKPFEIILNTYKDKHLWHLEFGKVSSHNFYHFNLDGYRNKNS